MRDDTKELTLLIQSRFPIIVVETPEEPRFMALVERATNLDGQALFVWTVAQGVARGPRGEAAFETNELLDALKHIDGTPQNGVFVFLDAQPYFDNPIVVRLIRELAMRYGETARTMIFVGSRVPLPPDLLRVSAAFRMTLPTLDDIRTLLCARRSRSGNRRTTARCCAAIPRRSTCWSSTCSASRATTRAG